MGVIFFIWRDKMKNEFLEYVSNFDMNNYHIKYKYNHSIRVNFNREDTKIIKTIGLLHDIGRFEQIKLTNGFNDNEFDHAAYGAMILFKEGLIEKFDVDPKDYEIIEFAILNHNRYNQL